MKLCDNCKKKCSICGQMFREYTCNICKKTLMWHNTNVPKVCISCSTKHNVCQRCRIKL